MSMQGLVSTSAASHDSPDDPDPDVDEGTDPSLSTHRATSDHEESLDGIVTRKLSAAALKDVIYNKLLSGCQNMFQWVVLQIAEI
ncbi:hypothetical protein BO70DRAFT_394758 [Aspergillus heteromorphus CBS 117.55]|uniref:Uncharacterized protein n=1 Tax=Aspergillus heteromorphus CBS 117.55 TaxID=1448321 RepID=A0A317WM23_9EURO|nr:uncharacterized protein BO70DRAFT_394758 [Aspergillus heteromorphus CBS 117.55]PWY86741.1 hypothetical protein BO70DRAFT_394758 [Aspergillus heteromorphus CBS 117.55]